MGKFIARLVVTLAVLYAASVAIFAFTYYPGEKPDVPTIVGDFNGWAAELWKTKVNPKPAQPVEAPAPAPLPEPVAPPPAAPVAPPGPPQPPPGLYGEQLELWKIEHVLLPEAAKQARLLREMSRADAPAFEEARTSIMASLGEARTLLGSVLDRDNSHRLANKLLGTLQELYAALKKL